MGGTDKDDSGKTVYEGEASTTIGTRKIRFSQMIWRIFKIKINHSIQLDFLIFFLYQEDKQLIFKHIKQELNSTDTKKRFSTM